MSVVKRKKKESSSFVSSDNFNTTTRNSYGHKKISQKVYINSYSGYYYKEVLVSIFLFISRKLEVAQNPSKTSLLDG